MSRFFHAKGDSDSETESSEDEVEDQKVSKSAKFRDDLDFMAGPEDDEKRVVRAQKDKKFDELKSIIKQNRDAKSNKDLNKLLTGFDSLTKVFEKSKTIFQRQNVSTPRFYIRSLVEIEDYVNKLWEDKDAKAALSKNNAKALPALRQKLKKYVKDQNLTDLVADYRSKPDEDGYETPEDEDDDDFEEIAEAKTEKSPGKAVAVESDSESDAESDDSWSSEPDTNSSDDEDSVTKMEQLRRYFLKKEFREESKDDKKDKRKRVIKVKEIVEEDDDDANWTPVSREKSVVHFDPKEEVTHDVMIKKLNEVMSARGKRTTDRNQHVANLQKLLEVSEEKGLGLGISVKISFCIISALFELNAKISDFMEYETFMNTLQTVNKLLDVLIETDRVKLSVTYAEEDENLKDDTQEYRIQGSILIAVQRLDGELAKILQNADCHSNDYIEKLKAEKDMCQLIEKAEGYVELRNHLGIFDKHEVCKVYMMRIEHTYYKYQEQMAEAGKTMDYLCKKIYTLDDEKRLRQRAMLCHVYWLAVHDQWHRARDLLLMSHMQAIVDHSDVDTQILYNRTICQLGLCAFRHGFIREAHQGLSEIQNTQRAKELLAQAVGTRQHEKTAEQEKIDRSRQVPYHMHINVELMECVYLICSMLLEIPHMASCEFEMRRRMLSRSFHYQLKQSEKASLTGPPENTREHVVAASKAMLNGDWKKCKDYIVNEKMNQKVWNLFHNAEPVKEMVVRRIQEESLRTYLLTYSTVYSTVSLKKLSSLFELTKKDVHSIISKMIIQEELSATLDEPTDCLIMHRVEPSRLQMLALNLSDKLQTLAENNEQILEPRTGRGGYQGPGSWFPGRNERQGDKQKGSGGFQGDRRPGTGGQDGKRGNWGGAQSGGGGSQQRRHPQKQRAF
uniref:Eukaryotic translation initiation factor 3 subunit C n=1 Tax=Caenorhabditis tropicalis TaxID=1561998 RepID=A0A1I7TR05_9PELO